VEVWAYGSDDEGPARPVASQQNNPGESGGSGTEAAVGDTKRRRSIGAAAGHAAGVPPPLSRDSSKRDNSSSKQQEAALAAALAKNQYGSFTVAEKAEVQRRLAGKIGGASHFALMELKKMAAMESPPTGHHRKGHSSHYSLHEARRGEQGQGHHGHQGHFDQGKVYPAGAGIADVLDHSNDAPTPSAERRAHHHNGSTSGGHSHHGHGQGHGHASGHRHHAAGHGMFGGQMRRHNSHRSMGAHSTDHHRPNPFAPKATHGHGHGSQTHSHTHSHGHAHAQAASKDNTAEIKALSQQVQTLSRTVEVQNDMIIALFSQIQQSLRQQQQQQQHFHQHVQGTSDKTAGKAKPEPEPEILFPEMAPSRNMAENVARFLPAVTPIHPNAHAKPLPASNISSAAHTVLAAIPPRLAPLAQFAHTTASVPQGHALDKEQEQTPETQQSQTHSDGHPPIHPLLIDPASPHKHGLDPHKSDLTSLNSPLTPATRSSTSTTSAEMSAFSLIAPEMKNK